MKWLDQKTYVAKVDGSVQKPRGIHLSRPCCPFWNHLVANLDFAHGVGLQAMSECPWCRLDGIYVILAALLEYAAILLLLKKRRKPLTEIQKKIELNKPVSWNACISA